MRHDTGQGIWLIQRPKDNDVKVMTTCTYGVSTLFSRYFRAYSAVFLSSCLFFAGSSTAKPSMACLHDTSLHIHICSAPSGKKSKLLVLQTLKLPIPELST